MKLSVQEIRAVAEAAITARHAADAAQKALEAAPDDASLKSAYEQAEQAAVDAKTKADALSQAPTKTPEQIAKIKRKRAILTRELQDAGEPVDDTDEDEDDDDDDLGKDPSRPVTFGDLQRMRRTESTQTVKQMAETITDPVAKQAVLNALDSIKPSGDPEKDFKNAVAIASQDKNLKVLEEVARRPAPVQHRAGPGAPARQEGEAFEPSKEEASFMKAFGLTKEDVLRARAAAAPKS